LLLWPVPVDGAGKLRDVLVLKLLLTPAVMVAATLVGRRYGNLATGWLVGLPLTSGPINIFFTVEHGPRFAGRAAVGSLSGAIGEVGFCTAYAATARRGWPCAVASGSAGFAVVAVAVEALHLSARPLAVVLLALAAVGALFAGLWLVPHLPPAFDVPDLTPSRFDLPARAVTATGVLLALTALATTLGPRLSGLLAVYPLYTVVLAAFAQRHAGRPAAVQILRGLLFGLFSFAAFYATLALGLGRIDSAAAYAIAFTAAFAVQVLTLRPLLRLEKARPGGFEPPTHGLEGRRSVR
jgi:hypothetical protein